MKLLSYIKLGPTLAAGGLVALAPLPAYAEPLKVQFGTASLPAFVAPHYAEAQGYYDAAGLEVELIPGRLSQDAVNAVAAGNADVAFALSINQLLTADKGQELISVGNMYGTNGFGLVVGKDTDITTLKGLEGHEVLVPASSYEQLLRAMIKNQGGDPEKVTYITVSQIAAMLQTYAGKQADAVSTALPFAYAGVETTRPSLYLKFADEGSPEPMYVWIVRPETWESRKEEITAFMRATYRAVGELNVDPTIATAVQEAAAPGSDPQKMAPDYNLWLEYQCAPGQNVVGVASADAWEQAVAMYRQIGLVTSDIQSADLFTNELFEGDDPVSTVPCPK